MARKNNRLYEIMIVVDASLDEARTGATIEKIGIDVTDIGGEIKNYFLWTKRYLAYPIKGKNEGQYFLMYAFLPAEFNFKKFERILVLDEKVLRHGIFKAETVLESISFKPLAKKELGRK